jgi:hypothetical protein
MYGVCHHYDPGVATAFISSVQRDFGDVREAAARAAEAYGLRVLMAERAAAGGSPKGALLSLVREADVFILILGARYGDAAAGQTSPTEDEFNEAVRIGLPILTFVQSGEREPRQAEFLERVRGAWAEGNLTANFTGSEDIGMQIMTALRRLEQQAAGGASRPRAEQRAAELARGPAHGSFSAGTTARVAYAALIDGRLLDDITLNRGDLGERASSLMRDVALVSQQHGIDAQVSGATGVRLVASSPATVGAGQDAVEVEIGLDGATVVQAPVGGMGPFGSSLVDPDRLAELVARSGRFAAQFLGEFDRGSRISQLAVAIGVPSAQHRVYGRTQASSLSMGGGMGRLPATLVAPEPPHLARREDLGGERLSQTLLAAVERHFRDAQATVGI